MTALYQDMLQGQSWWGQERGRWQMKQPGARVVAGFQTSSLQSCSIRTHWNVKYLRHDSTHLGCTKHGALWREKGTLSWERAREVSPWEFSSALYCKVLWQIWVSTWDQIFFFFFPLNDLFPFREIHNHPKILAFFFFFFPFFKALWKKSSVLCGSRKNLQNRS